MDLVKVASFPDRAVAEIASSALRAAGLHPRIHGDDSAAITGLWAFGDIEIEVLVPAEEHGQAREVLEEAD